MTASRFPFSLAVQGVPTDCRVRLAQSPLERLKGLLFSAPLTGRQGLWLSPCNSVHTFWMGYAIDVVFLSADGRVMRICEGLPARRMRVCGGAQSVLELSSGEAARLGIREGVAVKLFRR